jgi:hypothetical protein
LQFGDEFLKGRVAILHARAGLDGGVERGGIATVMGNEGSGVLRALFASAQCRR